MKSAPGELAGEHCVPCARLLILFSPGVVETKISVVLRLSGDGVSIGEKELEIGILKVVVTAHIDESRRLCLRSSQSFPRMRKNLSSELELFAYRGPRMGLSHVLAIDRSCGFFCYWCQPSVESIAVLFALCDRHRGARVDDISFQ